VRRLICSLMLLTGAACGGTTSGIGTERSQGSAAGSTGVGGSESSAGNATVLAGGAGGATAPPTGVGGAIGGGGSLAGGAPGTGGSECYPVSFVVAPPAEALAPTAFCLDQGECGWVRVRDSSDQTVFWNNAYWSPTASDGAEDVAEPPLCWGGPLTADNTTAVWDCAPPGAYVASICATYARTGTVNGECTFGQPVCVERTFEVAEATTVSAELTLPDGPAVEECLYDEDCELGRSCCECTTASAEEGVVDACASSTYQEDRVLWPDRGGAVLRGAATPGFSPAEDNDCDFY